MSSSSIFISKTRAASEVQKSERWSFRSRVLSPNIHEKQTQPLKRLYSLSDAAVPDFNLPHVEPAVPPQNWHKRWARHLRRNATLPQYKRFNSTRLDSTRPSSPSTPRSRCKPYRGILRPYPRPDSLKACSRQTARIIIIIIKQSDVVAAFTRTMNLHLSLDCFQGRYLHMTMIHKNIQS